MVASVPVVILLVMLAVQSVSAWPQVKPLDCSRLMGLTAHTEGTYGEASRLIKHEGITFAPTRLPAREVLVWSPPQQDDAMKHHNLGSALKEKGDLDGAIAEYRTAISQRQNFPEAHYDLGIALDAKGDLDGAIAEYRTAIVQRPNLPDAHYNLGTALRVKGDLDGAIAEYRTAISQRPNYPEATSALNNALRAKGRAGP